ncbi:hypothetical protein [Plantactinospora sp. B5E13]|uniref:hypothetical protein n=1 Tax=Plantactinospora sp. B5E13 TaxID=3153758 RepID=UPI00325F1846
MVMDVPDAANLIGDWYADGTFTTAAADIDGTRNNIDTSGAMVRPGRASPTWLPD